LIIHNTLFKPRRLPRWWLRFTEAKPALPVIISVAGLAWICFSIAHIVIASAQQGSGDMIETIKAVSGSKPLIERAAKLRMAYHNLFPAEVRDLVANLYGNIAMYLVVPFLLFLEFLFPCNPRQPLIGKGFLQDALWYIIDTPLSLLILFPVAGVLRGLFDHYLGFLSLGPATVWPVYLQIIAALLLAEFFIWFNHFARHKIRTLWFFHAVHHSQKEINVFTDNRAHIVDLLVGSLLSFIPFFIFHVSNYYAVVLIGIYKPIHNRFIHANIKINLGWLGWLFTSPQFHRVHHSIEAEHADKNFGVYFSIYDYLFGTACKSRDVYPKTGISDSRFPTEERVRVTELPKNLVRQTVYPFKQIWGMVRTSRLNIFRERNVLQDRRYAMRAVNFRRYRERLKNEIFHRNINYRTTFRKDTRSKKDPTYM
jgi:sterol desaturase/sphingolipid hydroxylase (fatty acid hydroxylase superfamily)